MVTNNVNREKREDRIEGDKIVLFDDLYYGSKTLKRVEIHTVDGKKRTYEIKRTIKGNYLFN